MLIALLLVLAQSSDPAEPCTFPPKPAIYPLYKPACEGLDEQCYSDAVDELENDIALARGERYNECVAHKTVYDNCKENADEYLENCLEQVPDSEVCIEGHEERLQDCLDYWEEQEADADQEMVDSIQAAEQKFNTAANNCCPTTPTPLEMVYSYTLVGLLKEEIYEPKSI